MTWEMVAQLSILILLGTAVVSWVLILIMAGKEILVGKITDRICYRLCNEYIPAVKDFTVDTTEEIIDVLKDKIPEIAKTVTSSMKEFEEKEDLDY